MRHVSSLIRRSGQMQGLESNKADREAGKAAAQMNQRSGSSNPRGSHPNGCKTRTKPLPATTQDASQRFLNKTMGVAPEFSGATAMLARLRTPVPGANESRPAPFAFRIGKGAGRRSLPGRGSIDSTRTLYFAPASTKPPPPAHMGSISRPHWGGGRRSAREKVVGSICRGSCYSG